MTITFPAMRGSQGGQPFYTCNVNLSDIPRIFTRTNTVETPVEQRAQRILSKSRISPIKNYILENEGKGYVFNAIVASYKAAATFTACEVDPDMGTLEFEVNETSEFNTDDGQHRVAGIIRALEEMPELGIDRIPIMFFQFQNLAQEQQRFSDLNRHAVKTPQSLNVLYNANDKIGVICKNMVYAVPAFIDCVDMERGTLPEKSPKLFTLISLYNATTDFKKAMDAVNPRLWPAVYEDQLEMVVDFWNAVSARFKEWGAVKAGRMSAQDLRGNAISAHSTVLRAIGSVGGFLRATDEKWKSRLAPLAKIDWHKNVTDASTKKPKPNTLWLNNVVIGGSVRSDRDARTAAITILRRALNIAEPVIEETKPADTPAVVKKVRKARAA